MDMGKGTAVSFYLLSDNGKYKILKDKCKE